MVTQRLQELAGEPANGSDSGKTVPAASPAPVSTSKPSLAEELPPRAQGNAEVAHPPRTQRRPRSAAELPRGERWKRRLPEVCR
jgi:hypothetical protein